MIILMVILTINKSFTEKPTMIGFIKYLPALVYGSKTISCITRNKLKMNINYNNNK